MQIVGYEPDPTPALVFASDGTVDREILQPGQPLSFTLADRYCAGVTSADGHVECDRPTVPFCEEHTSMWICAQCRGTCLKEEMDCYEEHAVYLAAFAPETFKVGVTRMNRIETRLREQGADSGAIIHVTANGRQAREIETEIATEIPDRVSTVEKIRGLHRSLNEDAWEWLLDRFNPIERFRYPLSFELTDQPIHETIATGQIVGTKGRVLVLEHGKTVYAVDLRDLVGYELRAGSTGRDLQVNLGAFG